MTDTIFCYHCRTRHPVDEVRKISTKAGNRWRCIKSIVATRNSLREREAFGRQTTAFNKAMAESIRSRQLPQCLMERQPVVNGLTAVGLG